MGTYNLHVFRIIFHIPRAQSLDFFQGFWGPMITQVKCDNPGVDK